MSGIDMTINLRPVQEYVGDRIKQVEFYNRSIRTSIHRGVNSTRRLGAKSLRTSIGLGALAVDQAATSTRSGIELLDKAEDKGADLEREVSTYVGDRVHDLEQRAGQELRRMSVGLKSNPAVAGSQALNAQLDRVLTVILPGNGGSSAALREPLAGYDALNAPTVKARLAGMSVAELEILRDYEARNKARITVLQAIDGEIRDRLAVM
jgi:hypothetical protein